MSSHKRTVRRGVRAIRRQFKSRLKVSWRLLKFQQELRANPTPGEAAVMRMLDAAGLDYQFQHILGRHILDFKLRGISLGIEVDGPYHETHEQGLKDLSRSLQLYDRFGLRVVRCTNEEAIQTPRLVLHRILMALTEADRKDIFWKCIELSRWFTAKERTKLTGTDTAGCVKTGDVIAVPKVTPDGP